MHGAFGDLPRTRPGDGVLHAPEGAFARGLPDLPAHFFARERTQALAPGAPTGLVVLDLSDALGLAVPASTPCMLGRYIVLRAGESFAHAFAATGEVHYVIRGQGSSHNGSTAIDWQAGDVFVWPGASHTRHCAGTDSVLFCVTDEPLLAMLGVPPPAAHANRVVRAAHYPADAIDAELEAVHRRTGPQRSAGKAVNFFTPAAAHKVSLLPTISAGMNTLEPGGRQRPHRHNAAALTLGIQTDRVHTLIDGQRYAWEPFAVVVTPARAPHAHYNQGSHMMKSLVLQDGGLFYHLRCTGFSWED